MPRQRMHRIYKDSELVIEPTPEFELILVEHGIRTSWIDRKGPKHLEDRNNERWERFVVSYWGNL